MRYPYLKRLPEFEYLAPRTVEEAISLLSQHNGKARAIAGGTDLLLKMKRREESPQYLVGLNNIQGLDYIEYDEAKGLRFGPLVTIHTMETSAPVKDRIPILAQAASTIGSAQIRNLGTVVGNLVSALPSADMAPGLIVLGATLKVVSIRGERVIAVEDFFIAPSESALAYDELVVEVQVPNQPPLSGMVYIKHTLREAMDLAIVGVAAFISFENDICREVRICLGTVAPKPMRAIRAEGILKGRLFDADLVKKAGETASQECSPRSTRRASAEYRREMVKILAQRALNQAKDGAR